MNIVHSRSKFVSALRHKRCIMRKKQRRKGDNHDGRSRENYDING